jgi:glycosyltransferase involved in cell wall biosynthesis
MRLILHDYSGHPFQAQLSRELARRGHEVDHVYCASYVSGKGRLEHQPDDPSTLSFTPLSLSRSFDKYTMSRRARQELAYARTFNGHVTRAEPDLVVMCNVPLLAHSLIDRHLHRKGVPVAFWHQDVYSQAMGFEAHRRFGPLGPPLARVADRMERSVAHRSRAIVAISDKFEKVHRDWGTDDKLHVIPNWAPVDEITPHPRDNAWARRHGLVGQPVLLYSGTLGLKHDPIRLVDLLREVRLRIPNTQLVVVSEGAAASALAELNEPGMTVLPFQPFETLPEVLASGDVLVTILEPEASGYSVPSKTLSYLCAGRPVVGLLPEGNPAHEIVTATGGIGIDLARTTLEAGAEQVAVLLDDRERLDRAGHAARSYAEANWNIRHLAGKFERVFVDAVDAPVPAVVRLPPDTASNQEMAEILITEGL